VRRSKLVNNTGGGIVVNGGGVLMLENSFVGGDVSDRKAIYIMNGTANMVYSTLGAGFGESHALFCDGGANTSVRNSLLLARTGDNDEFVCPGASIVDSALEMDIAGNVSLGNMATTWFIDGGFNNGNFVLSGTHPPAIETAATWQTGDPATDIAGLPRPTTDGTPDFAGAALIP